MASVTLRRVRKVYPNGIEAVVSLDLDVADGEFFAVLGPSGSGKSTLLRLIAGLEVPGEGSIAVGGRDVTRLAPMDRDVAVVFQTPALYPHLSVAENLAFGLRARGGRGSEVERAVEEVAGRLGLSGELGRGPDSLSGGQKQRVALGRAFVRRPSVFLLDEPLTSLDESLRAGVRDDLIDAHRRLGSTMIYVTHDQGEALAMGDRVGVMDRGRIVQCGTPREVYGRPASRFVAGFIGNPPMSLVPFEVRYDGPAVFLRPCGDGGGGWVEARGADARGPFPAGRVDLGFRAEDVALSPAEAEAEASRLAVYDAAVVGTEYLGHEILARLAIGPGRLVARLPKSAKLRAGDALRIGLDLAGAARFEPA